MFCSLYCLNNHLANRRAMSRKWEGGLQCNISDGPMSQCATRTERGSFSNDTVADTSQCHLCVVTFGNGGPLLSPLPTGMHTMEIQNMK
eukprot:456076-Amphidinium_carterae.1